jgi:hypothetical protein
MNEYDFPNEIDIIDDIYMRSRFLSQENLYNIGKYCKSQADKFRDHASKSTMETGSKITPFEKLVITDFYTIICLMSFYSNFTILNV